MEVLGSYTLSAFSIEDLDGELSPWGKELNGLLIYAPTGHMSVSINKAIENDPDQSEDKNIFDSILFYSGAYTVEGELIRHQVTNASNPGRIGKEMLRYATWSADGKTLTLVTPKESFGRAILVWNKIG
jgi:hypothetical protein